MLDRHEVMSDDDFFPLAVAQANRDALVAFRLKLRDLGYSEETITRTLGIEGPYALTSMGREVWPRYVIADDEPASVLIRLFLLSLPQPESLVRDVLGSDHLHLLRDLRLLSADGPGDLRSPIGLYPVGPLIVATDWWREPKGGPDTSPNRVMPLGRDSYGLARLIASLGGADAVDLCTGSGVGALKAALRFDRALGVDVNPRAINFARFNASLNDLDNCTFEQGDLYGPTGSRRFDMITANPPFVPVPGETQLLYRDGGPSGEDVLERIVTGCPAHLKGHGVGIIVSDLVEHRGTTYEEKLTRWLGTGSGSTAAVLRRPAETIYQYASTHLSHTDAHGVSPAMFEWIDHYLTEGIEEVARGYIVIRRSDEPDTRIMTIPIEHAVSGDVAGGSIEELLQRVGEASSQPVSDLRFGFRFHPGNAQLLPDGEVLAQVSLPYLVVSEMETAAHSEGGLSLDALVAAFRAHGYEVGPQRRAELEDVLRQLYVSGYLDAVAAQPGESARADPREAALKLWWSL